MAESRPIRVLCMEDNAGLARLLRKKLEQVGYVVDVASDGQEGLDMCTPGSYDVLAVDQNMPVREGLEVIRILAAKGQLPPTIMVTGGGSEEVAVEAMKLGASDYVVKDAEGGYLDLLPTVIERLLHQQRLAEEVQRAQDALRESEERYRTLFEGVPVGLYRTTVDGLFIDANPALVRILGYPDRETLLRAEVAELYLDPESRREWQSQMECRGSLADVELQLRRNDGTVIWVRDTARTVCDAEGRFRHFEGSIQDITERKEAEEALKEYSERLEEMVAERTADLRDAQEQLVRGEKLAVLGQMAGGVSHELRNPLGVISNAAQILAMTLSDADETTTEFLGMIKAEVRVAEKIVFDLLDFSQTRLPQREETAAADLVARALEKQPPGDDTTVLTELAPDLPPVYVDDGQIGLVLGNLISNACQAMPEGGSLTVGAQLDSGWVRLSVTDSGCGIPAENLAKIFEPLFTTRKKGIGLGLALVKNLVERNEGRIEVASEVGEGTTFRVWLPAKDGAV